LELHSQTDGQTDQSDERISAGSSTNPRRRRPFAPFVITFLIMFALWIVLSGQFDFFHLSLGVISCALVSFFSSDLLFPNPNLSMGNLAGMSLRFFPYIPWLMYQIFLANLHLLYLAFHPRMMDLIDPQIIKFKTLLRNDLARVAFANSITLTPGTISIYVSDDGYFRVHAIDTQSGEGLPGEMEQRIGRVFGEN